VAVLCLSSGGEADGGRHARVDLPHRPDRRNSIYSLTLWPALASHDIRFSRARAHGCIPVGPPRAGGGANFLSGMGSDRRRWDRYGSARAGAARLRHRNRAFGGLDCTDVARRFVCTCSAVGTVCGLGDLPADASVTAKPRLTCSSIGEGQQSEPEEQWCGA
jgi:hypothetical protein